MCESVPKRFAGLLRDGGHQVNVCRSECGASLGWLKFFDTSLGMVVAPALSAAPLLDWGPGECCTEQQKNNPCEEKLLAGLAGHLVRGGHHAG
jgi:hypothetical protein